MKPCPHRILYTSESRKTLIRLDASVRGLIRKAVESLALNPERGKPLTHDLTGLRSLRASDYRIIYRISGSELLVLVLAVGHRRDVYQRLAKLLARIGT